MLQDYEIDKAIEYGIEAIEFNKKVVNPSYKDITYKLKKLREKQNRVKARLMQVLEKNLDASLEEFKQSVQKQAQARETIKAYQDEIDEKLMERKQMPYYLALKDMTQENRYNKLKTESKLFINTIKMIAYRAETAVANMIATFYYRGEDDVRMLVKDIIKCDADLIPDYTNNTLTVVLHSLSTPRANRAIEELCVILNATETIYPATEPPLN